MKMKRKKLILPFVLRMIEQADDLQITEIIQAVIRRYAVIFPDWKIVFLSLPAD